MYIQIILSRFAAIVYTRSRMRANPASEANTRSTELRAQTSYQARSLSGPGHLVIGKAVQAAVGDGFCQVRCLYVFATRQIGNGTSQFQDTVIGAC